MCRAVKVLCLAPDPEALQTLKLASVGAEWELAAGATTTDEALAQIEEAHPHILVVSGPFEATVGIVKERYPGMRTIADFEAEGVDHVVADPSEIRAAIVGAPRPGGPVRAPKA